MADKITLHALPLTVAGVSILAVHTRWGQNPVYSLAEIYAATPGATFTIESYRLAMGPPVSNVATYWTGDTHCTPVAWFILTARLKQLGKLAADVFPATPDQFDKAEANRKAVANLVSGIRGDWSGIRTLLTDAVEYDGPVNIPVWRST